MATIRISFGTAGLPGFPAPDLLRPVQTEALPVPGGHGTRFDDEKRRSPDSLRFYFLGDNCEHRVEHVGTKASYNPQGPLIV
jgi:hypothetical protein